MYDVCRISRQLEEKEKTIEDQKRLIKKLQKQTGNK